jgi:hypothetical protein
MKKKAKSEQQMRDEYDFSDGVKGKYAARFAEGTNVVVLDSDVAEVFSDSQAVNDALRALAKIARKQTKKRRAS